MNSSVAFLMRPRPTYFARALIVVEGDGESLLLPTLAEKLGRPLSRHGVSIVNVGHRGLFRYSRILQRKAGAAIAVPVALIPDRDIPPAEAKGLVGARKTENELTQDEIEARMKALRRDVGDPVDVFIADNWTLEYDLALRPALAESVHQAVQLAKPVAVIQFGSQRSRKGLAKPMQDGRKPGFLRRRLRSISISPFTTMRRRRLKSPNNLRPYFASATIRRSR